MVDQTSQFYAILTNVGAAKQANADALGIPWKITQMGVGDANGSDPNPNATQTSLINEWRRAPLNQLKVDDKNSAIIVAEQVIPADVGGRWIREIALYDADGDMVAVANCAPTYKPLLSQGSGRTQVVRMNLVVSSASNVQLKIDPAVVLATRDYVDSRITEEINKLDSKQSVKVATTVNISLAGLQSVDGVALSTGDRILVKNQIAAKDNGLYVVSVSAWRRAPDADINAEVTSGLLVSVEQGVTLADTQWQLVTDGDIVLGTTALIFRNLTHGFAPIQAPVLVNPTANTPVKFDSGPALATTEFVQRAVGNMARFSSFNAATTLTEIEFGRVCSFSNGGYAVQLPTAASATSGGTIKLVNVGSGDITFNTANGENINMLQNGATSFVLGVRDSITLSSNGADRWFATDGSIAMVGSPSLKRYTEQASFTTPPQFTTDRKIATAEFVQRALGNFSSAVSYGADVTLTQADAGKIIRMAGTGYIVTLPLISTLAEGTTFTIQHSGTSGNQTVVAQGSDVIDPGAGTTTSLTLNMGDTAVLCRASGNWALIGGSVALGYVDRPTRPQFDNGRQLATTEFVQRALGNYAGQVTYSGSVTLSSEDVGKLVSLGGTAANIMLPDAMLVPPGALVTILSGTGGTTVQPKAGQTLVALNGTVGPFTLTTATLGVFRRQANGSGWVLEGGDAALKYSALFASNISASGYEKSPSGLITQWGMATFAATGTLDVTLPVTFPVQALGVICSYTYGLGGAAGRCGGGILSNSTIRLESAVPGVSGMQTMYWLAIGK